MTTGYRGGVTTPELSSMTLEQRVARLEKEMDERHRKAAERRMWLQFYGYNALIVFVITLVVYVVATLT